jgi:uncharacterized protein YqeY
MSIILVAEKPQLTILNLLEGFTNTETSIKDIIAGKQKNDLALAYGMQFELLKETPSALQNKTITLSETDADCSTLVYFSMQAATACANRCKNKDEINVVRNFHSTLKSTDYKFNAPEVDQQNELLKVIIDKSFKEIKTRRTEYNNFKTNEPPTYSEQEVLGHLVHLQRKLTQDEVNALTHAQFDLESGAITLTNQDTDLTGLMIETAVHHSVQDGKHQKIVKEFATSMIQGQHSLNPAHASLLGQIKGLAA